MANKKARGKRGKSRNKLRKRKRDKLTINKLLSSFEEGDRVQLDIEPAVHSAMPSPKLQGLTGNVIGHEGINCKVIVKRGNKDKYLVVHPVHLKKLT